MDRDPDACSARPAAFAHRTDHTARADHTDRTDQAARTNGTDHTIRAARSEEAHRMTEKSPAAARPVRVAHVIHSLGAGGAESVLRELAAAAPGAGIEMVVIGLSDAEDNRTALALREAGVTVHELHSGRYDARATRAVLALLRRERIDVVHTHLKHADVVGGAAARLAGLPQVSTLHVIEAAPTSAKHRALVTGAALARTRLADRVIALSQAQRDWYAHLAAGLGAVGPSTDRVVLLPNGVAQPRTSTPEQISALRSELGVQPGQTLGVTVSLLRPEKGHAVLLEAMRRLPAEVPFVLALAGNGPLLDEVRAQVAADPLLADRVRVLGFRSDVDELLAAADLVVHPSLEDALPTAVISAIAVGRPVLATNVGGIPDILPQGRLVPAGDADALAAAIEAEMADPEGRSRRAERGVEHYRSTFAAEVWARNLRALYDEIRAERAARSAERAKAATPSSSSATSLVPPHPAPATPPHPAAATPPRSAAVVSAVAPFPADSGKSVVMAGMLHHLAERLPAGSVHYLHVGTPIADTTPFGPIVVHEMGAPTRKEQVRALAVDVGLRGRGLQEAFLASPSVRAKVLATLDRLDVDLEIVDTLRLEQYVSGHPTRARRILYLDDLFSVRYQRMLAVLDSGAEESGFDPLGQFAGHIPGPLRGLTRLGATRKVLLTTESRRVARSEHRAARSATTSLLLNDQEAAQLRAETGADVQVVPPALPQGGGREFVWDGTPEFVFVGLLSLAHNHDGLVTFLRHGMPELLRLVPQARLHVVGRGAAPSLLAEAEAYGDRVVMHGFVPDLDDIMGPSCALLNALRFGSGVKIKVLEALSRGLPVVATEVGAEGVATSSRPGLTIVEDAVEAARALARLTDPAVRAEQVTGARQMYRELFAPDVVAARYDEVLGTSPTDQESTR